MEKLKVLALARNFMAGGIETSFINFVKYVKDTVDLDLFLCNNSGVLKDQLDNGLTMYEGNYFIKFLNRAETFGVKSSKKQGVKRFVVKFLKFVYNKLGVKKLFKLLGISITKKIKQEYDCAICFYAQSEICSDLLLKKINAKKKFAVIHADVSKFELDKKVVKLLARYDKILCVSQSCAEIFKRKYKELSSNVDYLYNFQNNEKIKIKSNDFKITYPNTFNIATVARLCEGEKGFTRSLSIFKRLHDEGYKFHWNIIGDGLDRWLVEKFIEDNSMDQYVTLYGNQSNPYPYVKAADLFYLGSYHEAAPVVCFESMILGVPVLTTGTSSAKELVGNNGFICENNEKDIYENMKFILDNKHLLEKERQKLKDYMFDNESNKKRFLELIREEKDEKQN